MATSPRCLERWQQQKHRKNEATEQHNYPTGKDPEEALHSDGSKTAEQPMLGEQSECVSECRSTPPLPDIPVERTRIQALEQGDYCLPLEMEVETDYELSSPTLTQRRMTQVTISDDSTTT
jgi:hypothetical protein